MAGSDADVVSHGVLAPNRVRKETSGVEFPAAAWVSFDRYSRYSAVVRAIRDNLGGGAHSLLDVGDNSGYLQVFDAQLQSISVDLTINVERLQGTTMVVGDGARLPIADDSVDACVSSDALEHVALPDRVAFLTEMVRVARALVVVAAPFDTPGVAGVEEFVRRYVHASIGQPQEQLEEHARWGLPSVDETIDVFERAGLHVAVQGDGNLDDWLLGMLIKHQALARPPLAELDSGFDLLYNFVLGSHNGVGPYYRHVVVARSDVAPATREPSALRRVEGGGGLLTGLLAANASEAVAHDLGGLENRMRLLLDEQHAELVARVGAIERSIDGLHGLLRHPVKRAVGRFRRRFGL